MSGKAASIIAPVNVLLLRFSKWGVTSLWVKTVTIRAI